MDYTLKRSRRKTLAIEVRSNAEVIIRAPKLTPEFYIRQFIRSHQSWINSKLEDIKNSPDYLNQFKPETGHEIYFFGNSYQINREDQDAQTLYFNGDQFIIVAPNNEIAMKNLISFYKKQAKVYLPKRISEISKHHNLHYRKVRITSAKTRWGSCSYQNNINLSYRLMMLPKWVIDYVLIHELVHTKIKDHSRHFWSSVYKLYPETQSAKDWIKSHRRKFPF